MRVTAKVILNAFEHNTNKTTYWVERRMALSDCICFECHLLIQRLFSIYTSNTLLAVVGMRRCTVRCTYSTPEGWSDILCFSLCDFGIRVTLLIALGSAHPFSYWVTNCYQGKRALFPSSGSRMPSFFSHTLAPHDTISSNSRSLLWKVTATHFSHP